VTPHIRSRPSHAGIRLVAAVLACCLAPVTAQARQEWEGADFQRRRAEWFTRERAFPNETIDWDLMVRNRMRAAERHGFTLLAPFASAVTGSWVPMGPAGFFGVGFWDSGPQLDAGRIDAIAVHPTTAGTLWIASPQGGIWKTTTGGATWSPVTDNQCSLQMSTVRVDPVNPSIVYAGAANASGAAGCAILRSTDGGASWANWNGGLNFTAYNGGFINEFYIDPATAGSTTAGVLMFNYGGAGIYRSANSGQSWTRTLTYGYVTSIVSLPGSPNIVFAGVADYATASSTRSGIYRSADKGLTWTQVAGAPANWNSAGRFQLATSGARPGSVWTIVSDKSENLLSINRYDDGSASWAALPTTGIDQTQNGRTHFGTQGTYDLVVNVDPTDANRLYIAGVRAFRSTDGGTTWTVMGTEIHCDWHTIVVDPTNTKKLYAGTDGGVFVSNDGGDTWVSRNFGLLISMIYPGVSQHPTDPNILLGGLQDNGVLLGNGTSVFTSVRGGDGGYTAFNFLNTNVTWMETQWSAGPSLIKRTVSAGGAVTLTAPVSGISTTDRALFIPPFVMDPVTPTTLYFGTQRLYRTTNDGALWTALTGDLSLGSGSIRTIAIAPTDVNTIYVGTTDGNVQVSRDGGATFALRTTGLPARAVTDITVDRTDPTRAIVTLSGQSAAHVYLTTNAGSTWTSINGNLPDMPANASVIIDDSPNHIFVATDVGVWETTDGGLSWTATPAGLPTVVVNDLHYNPTTRQLIAATYGRGLFKFSLANPAAVLRGDVNRDGTVNAADALLIQQALLGNALPAATPPMPNGDATCNGTLDAADALAVLRHAVGLTTAGACVGTNR
jgi:photosystem II stability/assembly factor-like uncharacterized protein